MILFAWAWGLLGLAYWVERQLEYPLQLGIIGDVILGLPLCLLFGPIWLVSRYL